MKRTSIWLLPIALVFLVTLGLSGIAQAAPPVVKTVPWVASNPLIPHDTWSGAQITLKGTSDMQGATITYIWDFGDGSAPAAGTVSNQYAVEAMHTYTGATGTFYAARLTVTNTATSESASKEYYVMMQDKSLSVEVNRAIDEGLWYLHKTQYRYSSGGIDYGTWATGSGYATYGYYGVSGLNTNAFEVNGHLESGPGDDPYTETVARAMKWLFTALYASSIGTTHGLADGTTITIDGNGNGLGAYINQSYAQYQTGMMMDAIVASGTPDAMTTTGPANIINRKYKDVVQDLVDGYLNCMYTGSPGGGWRYNCGDYPDNSACQWGAIAIIPAERLFGASVDPNAKNWNKKWLAASQYTGAGYYFGAFGYQPDYWFPWGPFATTPSGMVQMGMDLIGRGNTGSPSWDQAETFMRDNFCTGSGSTGNVKDYYYGLFSFVKSMLLAVQDGTTTPVPIQMLQSKTAGMAPIDWYAAEAAKGDPCDGVARTLVNDQNPAGYWFGHNYSGQQYYLETGQAIIMLNRTLFEAGAPVAVAKATPSPALANEVITLDGTGSFHQDGTKNIVKWEWDLNNDGIFDKTGPVVTTSFPALGNYPVTLRVTDDSSPNPKTASTTITVLVTIPPVAPTADANGPYYFCPQAKPWFLDGSKSVNPDNGVHEPGSYPGDYIKEYAWDLNGGNNFDAHDPSFNAYDVKPDVTAFFSGKGAGAYLVQLRVKDNSAASFPSSGGTDLTSTSAAQVFVKDALDPACASCISDLKSAAKAGKVQLTWTHTTADHYDVYRGTVSGGPYTLIATTQSTYSLYLDTTVKNGTTYYYVVREASINNAEYCQSNETMATPALPKR
jgi:PKD repeat protein